MLSLASKLKRASPALLGAPRRTVVTYHRQQWQPRTQEPLAPLPTPTTLEGFVGRLDSLRAAGQNDLVTVLNLCTSMKAAKITPNLRVFENLFSTLGAEGLHQESWAVYDDLISCGLEPSVWVFSYMLNAHRFQDASKILPIIEEMKKQNVEYDSGIYSLLINRAVAADNLELGLDLLFRMSPQIPTLSALTSLVNLAGAMGSPKLALDIAQKFPDDFPAEVWVNLLISSSERLWAEGVLVCWKKVVVDLQIVPDEGCCISALNTAARHGLPDLATDILRVVKLIGAPWKEYHFAPIVTAMVNANRLPEAFETLSIMRACNVIPTTETTHPICLALSANTDTLDSVWDTLDEMSAANKPIDPSLLVCVVRAAIQLHDLQRAVGAYKSFEEFKVAPTTETYNLLLKGCVEAQHRPLGDQLLREMKPRGLAPDVETYSQMCHLCLTQEVYEDTFFYLEETKAAGFVPVREVYETLVVKCVDAGDVRWEIALQEMEELEYAKSHTLQRFLRDRVVATHTPAPQ